MNFIQEISQLADNEVVRLFLNILDILLVWYVIYKGLTLIRGTKAVQLLKGIFVIFIIRVATVLLGLDTLGWITKQIIDFGFLAIIIIFQPEIRRALEQIGRGKLFSRSSNLKEEQEQDRLVQAMTKSVGYMAKRRIGALVSIEKDTGLTDYIETGIQMNSEISSE